MTTMTAAESPARPEAELTVVAAPLVQPTKSSEGLLRTYGSLIGIVVLAIVLLVWAPSALSTSRR